ncbi:CBS domain-containing protein [Fictibacillus terranigra]|uniref:CBS domain-containing protein n=1 Tax=Fictibacillus terranigra TaxID=3058424 RepID=A0ABT8EB18_9BACL|nr:CBS domain-containing protein [Fictibacillus sp. CENA-BCM004]MDN4075072.1 CBS domain-containing protein [Fictibacillus sp. CENA-BCM004]
MKVQEFMISNVIKANPDDTLRNVLRLLVQEKIGGVPVVDEHGKLLGMVSDGDILRSIKPRERQIYDFFSFVFSPQDEMEKVLHLLAKHHFKKLPVVEKEKRVVGVISRGDVIRRIQQALLQQL